VRLPMSTPSSGLGSPSTITPAQHHLRYTFRLIFSELPEKLSTNLTSLGEGRERLAIVVDMMDDRRRAIGRVGILIVHSPQIRPHSHYDGVGAWL